MTETTLKRETVLAVDGASVVQVGLPALAPPAPPTPTGLSALAGDGTVALNWDDAPAGSNFSFFRVYRDGVAVGTRTVSDFNDLNLTNGTTYSYRVSMVTNAGVESALSAAAPATPQAVVGGTDFMTRPASGLITRSNQNDFTITNLSINGGLVSSPAGIGITLINCKRVRITFVDFQNLVGGIYISQCEDVVIEDCRGRNIGDGTIGSGHSNYIQFADSRGGAVRRCKFLGGRTEDMVSTWHSGGWGVGQELIIEDNQLEGLIAATATARPWTSASGTGIIISDGGGYFKNGYVIVRRNRLLNPGQVGIQHIDGPGLQTYENIIYAEPYGPNNNPMTTWEGTPLGVARDNRYRWFLSNGSEASPWQHANTMTFTNNIRDLSLTAAALRVTL